MLHIARASNSFANLPIKQRNLYKVIAKEVSTNVVEELKESTEYVQSLMALVLWHLIHYKRDWTAVTIKRKENYVEIIMENAIFLVCDPE